MTQADNRLIDKAGVSQTLDQTSVSEEAWIEVIHKMDEVYADLVRYQMELEAKNAELEEAHRFIHSVLTSMNDVLIVCDLNGGVEQVNPALLRLTGRSEAAVLNMGLSELFVLGSRLKVVELLRDGGRQAVSDCEVALLANDGSALPLAMNCSPHYDHDGRLQGVVLMGRPVGELRQAYDDLHKAHLELKQTQAQLVQSEKMASLGRLVAGVAHELNNPISFVFGNTHVLKRYGERVTRYLSAIDEGMDRQALSELRAELKIDRIMSDMGPLIDGTLEGAERVSDIVQDLRRYSGAQREPVSRFDLAQLIKTSLHWVLRAERHRPALSYDVPETLEITSRKGHLQQILVNLFQNAVDVMEGQAGAALEIVCRRRDGRVFFSVRDYGPGIAADVLSNVFDPFFTTKAVGKGTGLGLSISYGLAQKIGGELRADNHAEGGAVFSLTLPEVIRD